MKISLTRRMKIIYLILVLIISNASTQEGPATILLQEDGLTNSKLLQTRNLQASSKMYTSLYSVPNNIEIVGNTLAYDSTNKQIWAVYPDTTNNYNMKVGVLSETATSAGGIPSAVVSQFTCTFKDGVGVITSFGYNIAQITNSPTSSANGQFVIVTNNAGSTTFPDFNCAGDNSKISIVNLSSGAIVTTKTWTNVISSTRVSNINTTSGNQCTNCNVVQPRASVWVENQERLVVWYLLAESNTDISSSQKLFIMAIFDVNPLTTPPLIKLFIFQSSYSNSLKNVRRIFSIPGTSYVYFYLQQGASSFITVINITTANNTLNPGTKINLSTDLLSNTNQYGLYYDSSSDQFIELYVSSISGSNSCVIKGLFFKLNGTYDALASSVVKSNIYTYTIPGGAVTSNAIQMVRVQSNFIYFCDYYSCVSAKLTDTSLGYGVTTLTAFTSLSSSTVSGGYMKINNGVINSTTTDVWIWFQGQVVESGSKSTVLGNSYPIATSCNFYLSLDGTKCQSTCETNFTADDATKICNGACSNPTPYLLNSVCSTDCGTKTLVKYGFECVDACDSAQFETDKSLVSGVIYNQCYDTCPGDLYTETALKQCIDSCPDPSFPYYNNQVCGTDCGSNTYVKEGFVCTAACDSDQYTVDKSLVPGAIYDQCYDDCGSLIAFEDPPGTKQCVGSCAPPKELTENGTCVSSCSVDNPYTYNNNCLSTCPTNSPYANGFTCSTSCPGPEPDNLKLIKYENGVYSCINNPIYSPNGCNVNDPTHCTANCPGNNYRKIPKEELDSPKLYDECRQSCPDYLFENGQSCSEDCTPNDLYEKVKIGGVWVKRCISKCTTMLADIREGVGSHPYSCFKSGTNKCPTGTWAYRPFDVEPRYDSFSCATECANIDGHYYYKYYSSISNACIRCGPGEGYVLDDECPASCPQYYAVVNGNKCQNCKTIDKVYYNGECMDKPPKNTQLVDSSLNAYVSCADAGKKVFKTGCVDTCPEGSYEYYTNKNYCFDLGEDKMYLYEGKTIYKCPNGYGPDSTRVCYHCYGKSTALFGSNGQCLDSCPTGYYYDEQHVCIACTTPGSFYDEVYRSRCLTPYCPSNSYLDLTTRTCVYCKDLEKYMYDGTCVYKCPYNTMVDYERYECLDCTKYSTNYLYNNKCYATCPEGTTPTDIFTCELATPSCDPNPCQNEATCTIEYNNIKCTCKSSRNISERFVGKYCQISENYMANFYTSYNDYITQLTANYTRYSSINTLIINPGEKEIKTLYTDLGFLEDNYPEFVNDFETIIDNLLTMMSEYFTILKKSYYMPDYEWFDLYDYLFGAVERFGLLLSRTTATGRRLSTDSEDIYNTTDLQATVEKMQLQVRTLSEIFVQKDLIYKLANYQMRKFKNFKVAFWNTTHNSLLNATSFLVKQKHSIVEFTDCEEFVKNNNTINYTSVYSIDWTSDITKHGLLEDKSNFYSSVSVTMNSYSPLTYSALPYRSLCATSSANRPVYIRFNLDFNSKISRRLYDYYFNKEINIYDGASRFYNDRCFIYVSDDGFDVTQKYRKLILSPNVTIDCGIGCTFIGFDYYDYSVCQCDDVEDVSKIYTAPYTIIAKKTVFETLSGNNLGLLNCIGYVFASNYGLKNVTVTILGNIGFWFGIAMVVTTIGLILLYSTVSSISTKFSSVKVDANGDKTSSFVDRIFYIDAFDYTKNISPFFKLKKDIEDYKIPNNVVVPNEGGEIVNEINRNAENARVGEDNQRNNFIIEEFGKINFDRPNEEQENMLASRNDNEGMVDLDTLYIKKTPYLKSLKFNHNLTRDYNPINDISLSYQDIIHLDSLEVLNFDNRSNMNFYFDWLVNNNYFFFAFFNPSIMYPHYLRILIFMTNVSLEFCLNAMLFSDEYIDLMIEEKEKYGFYFVFKHQFQKCIMSIILAQVPILIVKYRFLRPPQKIRRNFNEFLLSKNYSYIMKGQ